MVKRLFLLAAACAFSTSVLSSVHARNPILPGYFPDPHVLYDNGKFYIYATIVVNPQGAYGRMVVWESQDFVHWKMHNQSWPTFTTWAPDAIKGLNGRYYIYPTNATNYTVWVGVGNSPIGPFVNARAGNDALIPTGGSYGDYCIDGQPFIDTDNQAYMYWGWGACRGIRLNADMATVTGSVQNMAPRNYVEAPYMIKRNGRYYFMYSYGRCQDETYKVDYSTATGPFGSFTYGTNNPILSSPPDLYADGPGHNSILKLDTSYYIIYHGHDYPRTYTAGSAPDGIHRQTFADRFFFNADGSIAKVVTTKTGVGALGPLAHNDTNLAKGKTAVASSTQDTFHSPARAFDESYRTHWSASGTTYPQWLRVDLGQSTRIDRCESEFEYPSVAYRYRIEHSADNVTWTLYADRTGNTVPECPSVDSGTVTARYVRITLTGCATAANPASLWEFSVMQKRATGTVPGIQPAAEVSPEPLKRTFIASGGLFNLPPGYSHKNISAGVFTVSGKRLAVLEVKGNRIDLRKECGISSGIHILKLRVLR
ncbi:MAG: family 43 glycosylhydrolase [Chitinispirillaceae bacterium]|nr:family 43 glycosylhydrolase [Chitinispirillaceae bacterium]